MKTNTRTQLRGHCQLCGRLWAVPDGRMSKHGYTVKNGWFEGVCPGMNYAPLEVSREQTDQFIKSLREQAPKLRAKAEDYESGAITPMMVTVGWNAKAREPQMVPWLEAAPYHQRKEVESLVWKTKRRAELAESTANDLEALADKVHGKPVAEVKVDGGPPPILSGEIRVDEKGRQRKCSYCERGRVYYTLTKADGQTFKGWMGSRSWRNLRLATKEEA